jgi:hypothetical protein
MYKTYLKFSEKRLERLQKRDELKGDLGFASRQPKIKKLKELTKKLMTSNQLSPEEQKALQSLTKEKVRKLKRELPILLESERLEQLEQIKLYEVLLKKLQK